jgi:hypothetical protein
MKPFLLVSVAVLGAGTAVFSARAEQAGSKHVVMISIDGLKPPKAGNLGVVRMTQIAPTIASWLGVALSPGADAPLDLRAVSSR